MIGGEKVGDGSIDKSIVLALGNVQGELKGINTGLKDVKREVAQQSKKLDEYTKLNAKEHKEIFERITTIEAERKVGIRDTSRGFQATITVAGGTGIGSFIFLILKLMGWM